ncbi:hypothetical protein [Antarctobacter jejuensis]|uniref:hypothetical protein n=1 Tax=Antarctobacter jejuensis TaxID=1439938 RepID=UPI003FD2F8FE
MTTAQELAALLARASAVGVDRQGAQQGLSEDALGLALRAIRNTILPRCLTIQADTGAMIKAEVSGGTLQTLVEVQGAESSGLTGHPLRATDPAEVSAVAKVLEDLFGEAVEASVRAEPPSVEPDPAQSGISAEVLMRHLGLAPFAAAVPDPLDHFQEAAADVLAAVHKPEGGETPLREGFRTPLALHDAIVQTASDPDGPLGEIGPGEILFLAPFDSADLAIGLTNEDGNWLALVFDADSLPELSAYWSGMPHGMVRLLS